MRKRSLGFFVLAVVLLLAAGCGGRVYLVTSLSLPRAIVVDGDAADWAGALSYVAKDQLFVGFVNDRDDLFLCMTREEAGGPAPAPMGGWTVWFDPAGGTKKAFGLRVAPLGGPSGEKPRESEEVKEGDQGAPKERDLEIQWIGPQGNVLRRFAPEDAAGEGLEVREGHSGRSFVLEIKIPLERSARHPIAVGAAPGDLIGVGFFSNRAEGNGERGGRGGAGRPAGGGGPPGGLGGGAMGGPGGWRGAMPPNLNPDIAKEVKVWTRVRLVQSGQPGRATVLGSFSE